MNVPELIERIDKMIAGVEICGAHTVSLTPSEAIELLRLARIGVEFQKAQKKCEGGCGLPDVKKIREVFAML